MAKPNIPITNEDVENLIQITSMASYPVIIKLLKVILKGMEKNILDFDGEKESINILATRSARYKGANFLLSRFMNEVDNLTGRNK